MNWSSQYIYFLLFIIVLSIVLTISLNNSNCDNINNNALVFKREKQFKTHLKIHNNEKKIKQNANSLAIPSKIATYFSKGRYAYPAQVNNTNKPVICIISLGGSYKTSDLQTYWTSSGYTSASFVAPTFHTVDGVTTAPNQSFGSSSGSFYGASMENTLDLEIAMTLCPAAEIHFFSGPNSLLGFLHTIQAAKTYLVSLPNTKCKIISISWGMDELSYDPITILSYNATFADAQSKGISVCAASGDNSADDGSGILSVDFPASSPYVISCGGTSYNSGSTETAWSYNSTYGWGGGGGYSMFFDKPSYQNVKVTSASSVGLIGSALLTNRSVPDIAMNADPLYGWAVYFNGAYATVGGTSCVSPAFAAFLGLCNKPSSAYNASTNVLTKLYTAPTGCFNDIASGTNNSLGLSNLYTARAGYDQCTGLGSIIGTTLISNL